ncbi:MAG TPA: diaminopimelate epimerase, partial [Actinobacteria bacterium]|nr:diaminopimelate epimerase [Actinomycetota bacterium]
MAALNEIAFTKGHGTANDFVILADLDGRRELSADDVRFLCNRHEGIGADGVLRIVRTHLVPEFANLAHSAEFFMDYRNADGS